MVATRNLCQSARRTPHRVDPPKQLVTEDQYCRSRNPVILPRLLVLIGLAILLSSLGLAGLSVGLFLLLELVIVPREESRLAIRYGAKYIDYRNTVSRWIALRPADGRGRHGPRT